jgi:hypothetical protein
VVTDAPSELEELGAEWERANSPEVGRARLVHRREPVSSIVGNLGLPGWYQFLVDVARTLWHGAKAALHLDVSTGAFSDEWVWDFVGGGVSLPVLDVTAVKLGLARPLKLGDKARGPRLLWVGASSSHDPRLLREQAYVQLFQVETTFLVRIRHLRVGHKDRRFGSVDGLRRGPDE